MAGTTSPPFFRSYVSKNSSQPGTKFYSILIFSAIPFDIHFSPSLNASRLIHAYFLCSCNKDYKTVKIKINFLPKLVNERLGF